MSVVRWVPLGDVAVIERDTVDASDICSGSFYVGLENIETGGHFIDVRQVSAGELASNKFRFTSKHLLYGKLRPYLAKIARPDFDGICSTDIIPMLPGPHLDRGYVAWMLLTPALVAAANSRASGANLPRISPRALAAIEIPLPPLSRQRRIAEILDKAAALRAKRRAALAQLDILTQSIFLHMFGDPISNSRGWPMNTLALLGSVERGVSKHRPRGAPELLGGPYPLIQTGDVANCDGYVRTFTSTYSERGVQQSRIWPAGTLCITIAANIAKTGILTFDACFPDSVVAFRCDEVATVQFVRIYLSFLQASLERIAPESAQKNINLEILRKLKVPTPPLNLQREFARSLNAIETLRMSGQSSITQLDALLASLQHRAFRGEL